MFSNIQIRILSILYWGFALAFLIFFIMVEIPIKGLNWSDVGMYYAISNSYVFGQFNEYGMAGLFNALLIKLNFGYVNLSRFFSVLQFSVGLLFVFSLKFKNKIYWIAPIAVTLMVCSNLIQISSYETSGPVYLMLATALLYICINYKFSRVLTNVCYALSAFFYCFSSITNLMLAPSLLVNAIILFLIYPKIRNKTFIISYIVSTVIAIYIIAFKILPIFEMTTYYSPDFLTVTITRALIFSAMILGLFFAGYFGTKLINAELHFTQWALRYFFKRAWSYPFNLLSAAPLIPKSIFYGIALVFATYLTWLGLKFLELTYYEPLIYWPYVLLIYSFIYLGVIFAIYGWQFYKDHTQRLLALALILHLEYFLAMTASTLIPWQVRSLSHASEIALIIFMWLEYFWIKDVGHSWKKISVVIILIFSSWWYPMNTAMLYAYGQSTAANKIEITNIPRLNGVYVDPQMSQGLEQVVAAYNQYNCKDKLFITRARFPIFYFIFNRQGYPPYFYLDSLGDLKRLASAKNGYCYFADFDIFWALDAFRTEKTPTPTAINLEKLVSWLEAHSKHVVKIPTTCIGCSTEGYVQVYVG